MIHRPDSSLWISRAGGCLFFIDIPFSILGIIKSIFVAELSSMSISDCFWNPFKHKAHVTTCSKESDNSIQFNSTMQEKHQSLSCTSNTSHSLLSSLFFFFLLLIRNSFFLLLFSNKAIKCNEASSDLSEWRQQ